MRNESNNIEQKSLPPCTKCGNHINVKLIIDSDEIEISCPKCNMLFKVPFSAFKIQIEAFHQYKQYCERDKSHSSIKGSYYCSNCNDYFCKDCAEDHKRNKSKILHNIILLDDYRVTKCKVHHKKATFYCITCKDYLCDACTNGHNPEQHIAFRIEELNTYYNFIKKDYYNFKEGYKKYLTNLYDNTIQKLEELIQKLNEKYKNNLKKSEEIFNLVDLIVYSYDTSYPNYQDLYNVLLNTSFSFTPFEEYLKNKTFNNYYESIFSYFSFRSLVFNKPREDSLKRVLINNGNLVSDTSYKDSIFLCFLEERNELFFFNQSNHELCVYSFKEGRLSSKLKTDFSIIRSVCKVSDDLVLISNSSGIFLIQIQDSIRVIQLKNENYFHQTISLFDNGFASISIKSSNNYSIEIFKNDSSFISLFSTSSMFSKESKTLQLFSSEQKTNNLSVKHKNNSTYSNKETKDLFFFTNKGDTLFDKPELDKPESVCMFTNTPKGSFNDGTFLNYPIDYFTSSQQNDTQNLFSNSQPNNIQNLIVNSQGNNTQNLFSNSKSNSAKGSFSNSQNKNTQNLFNTLESEIKSFNLNLLKRIEEVSIFILGTKDNKYIGSITSNEIHFWNIKSYSCDGVIKNIECDNKSTMIEIDDNRLIIQGQSSLYIINYHTFQIETVLLINSNSSSIRSMSILNCKDIIFFTGDTYLIRISSKTFTQIKKSLYSLDKEALGNNKMILGQKPSYIINLNDGSQRNIVCSSLPSVIEIYSTLNLIQRDSIKKIKI